MLLLCGKKRSAVVRLFCCYTEAGRGSGIGSVFLQKLAGSIKAKGFIIECEAPEKP